MKIMYNHKRNYRSKKSPPHEMLIDFINQHGCKAFVHSKGILAVCDGYVSNLIPASRKAVLYWLNY